MIILKNTNNIEVYVLNYQDKPAIYKYSNTTTHESEILIKTRDIEYIPNLLNHQVNVASPSGKIFKELLIIEYVKPKYSYPETPFCDIPKEIKRDLINFALDTLEELHNRDIYHCDISYNNFIYGQDNHWYLIDFNTSQLTRTKRGSLDVLDIDHWGVLSIAGRGQMRGGLWQNKSTRELREILWSENKV